MDFANAAAIGDDSTEEDAELSHSRTVVNLLVRCGFCDLIIAYSCG